MIQKRYQYYTKEGIKWSSWYSYPDNNTSLEELQEKEYWQLKGKLRNEFRKV